MIISDQTLVLFLLIGVAIGIIYTVNKAIIVIFSVKKIGRFCLDFTFVLITCVLTFIGALPTNGGMLRALQIVLEIIGALSFYFAAGELILFIISLLRNKAISIKHMFKSKIARKSNKLSKNMTE